MRIACLCDNVACNEDYGREHGLSIYMEVSGQKILFDAGQSDVFLRNAEALGIDLADVDYFVLSHGHYDHGGGITNFLKINKKAKIYLSLYAFGEHLNGTRKYIGLDLSLKESDRIVFVEDYCELFEGAELYSCNGRELKYPINSAGLLKRERGALLPDDFKHELYLKMFENGRTYLISGCSHRGILNIMSWFSADYLIGGFHFKDEVPSRENRRLDQFADELLGYNTMYFTGHCTGEEQFFILKEKLGEQLKYFSAGQVLEI